MVKLSASGKRRKPTGFTPYRGSTPFAFRRRNAQGLPMLHVFASEPHRGSTPCRYFVSLRSQNISRGPVAEKHPMLFHPYGFTLVELLVVISIISLLSSVVFASVNSARRKGRDAARVSNVQSLKMAMELYYDDNNGYPTSNGSGNGDVPLSDATLVGKLVPKYIPTMPALLIADGDHYYGLGVTSGVTGGYDMLIYNKGTISANPCRSGTVPGSTGDWGVAAVCNF